MTDSSIVEYFSGNEGYRCGYCKSDNTCYSHGMWTHTLTPLDYQNLIDRGWRRSGKYCYKPTMHRTCCPQYTIKCEAKKFVLSRSQKKVLKKIHKFLAYGEKEKLSQDESSEAVMEHMEVSDFPQAIDMQSLKNIKVAKDLTCQNMHRVQTSDVQNDSTAQNHELCKEESLQSPCNSASVDVPAVSESSHSITCEESSSTSVQANQMDLDRPPCRKAKLIRRERKLQKLLKMGVSADEAKASMEKKNDRAKSLEDFINQPLPAEPAHKLELRLVPSALENPLFSQTFEESYEVYKKYQMSVHKDTAEKCSKKQYNRFLVNSPFQHCDDILCRSGYGSFHQQYWLDNKLIAVGVIDILPYCVSSVYFYYDPSYSFLSLGTYAALREIALTRELNIRYPALQHYYMGFYIHSCVKMRYKGQYFPSFLLCPETFIFQPIEKCRPKLDVAKYQRLEEDSSKGDPDGVVNLKEVLILFNKRPMIYPVYRNLNRHANDENLVKEYAGLVGRKCYRKMLLYRN
ncbi:arginyl-tRNA--protein transferase 1-like isoform X2 [Stegodyphus dumicola]|uniref:arginyl-tRNA--protein transferase 1-like isoform X2 n=1 Tax=Stegodyphus dumicola TaxID=202533 RepID=UPI0015B17293|nr:arginyl-tRNA--protein transferase 1-like isoform X2 [Stegodyphus dumicola]